MKILTGFVLFVLMGVYADAQHAKVIAELSASSEKVVKNSPFSAEAVSESVQVLGDGNRIVRSSTSKLYRNSEGRFRREMDGGSGGMFGSMYSYGQGVTILDPVMGHRYLLDSHLKTARVMELKAAKSVLLNGKLKEAAVLKAHADKAHADQKASGEQGALAEHKALAEKFAVEARAAVPAAIAYGQNAKVYAGAIASTFGGPGTGFGMASHTKYETKTEELGSRVIEGVEAEGKRTVTTIPAGDIGNERPIEIVYERWYSNELELVVMSKHSDPRFGEQTYRVTNIIRSEPDSTLFTLPAGYKLLTEPAGVYRITTKTGEIVRAPVAPKAVTVVTTKPNQ